MKKRVAASQWFRSADDALNTIAGYEPMNIIRKGQIRWLPKTDIVGQVREKGSIAAASVAVLARDAFDREFLDQSAVCCLHIVDRQVNLL